MKPRKLSKTGHEQIDQEHNELIYMLNGLSSVISRRTEDKTIIKFFDNLIKSAEYHIKNEEQLMLESDYPDLKIHKEEHILILEELKQLKNKLQTEIFEFKAQFASTNKNWIKHLYKNDKPFVKYLKKKS